MAPLVLELQQLAQSSVTDVSELLRRAKVVASKLQLDDFDEWFEHELNGYPETTNVPNYRIVATQLVTKNPYHGLQPVVFVGQAKAGELSLAEHFRSMPMRQPVAQIAHLVSSLARGSSSGALHCALGPGEMEALLAGNADFELVEPVRVVNNGDVVAVLDAVRNRILKWSLDLERKGIRGANMTFTKDEQDRAASQITINNYGPVGSVVYGATATVTTVQGSPGSVVSVATGAAQIQTRLRSAIDAVRRLDEKAANSIENIAAGISSGVSTPEDVRTEATEALVVVAEQCATKPEQRLPKSVLTPVVLKLRDALSLSADLLQVWTTFGPAVLEWLSIAFK